MRALRIVLAVAAVALTAYVVVSNVIEPFYFHGLDGLLVSASGRLVLVDFVVSLLITSAWIWVTDPSPRRGPVVAAVAVVLGNPVLLLYLYLRTRRARDLREEDADLTDLERRSIADVRLVPVVASAHPLALHEGSLDADGLAETVQIVLSEHRHEAAQVADKGVLSPRKWRVADLATKHALIAVRSRLPAGQPVPGAGPLGQRPLRGDRQTQPERHPDRALVRIPRPGVSKASNQTLLLDLPIAF